MKIENVKIDTLTPYKNNPRKNEAAIEPLMASIRRFGFRVPVVIDKDGVIIAGHTRYLAAKRLGIKTVPVVRAENLTEEEAAAYRLVDNKTQELAGWKFDELIPELVELNLDMSEFGFEMEDKKPAKKDKKEKTGAVEIDIDDFADEAFDYECPYCGFRFNG